MRTSTGIKTMRPMTLIFQTQWLWIIPDLDQKNYDRNPSISIRIFFSKKVLPRPEDLRKPLPLETMKDFSWSNPRLCVVRTITVINTMRPMTLIFQTQWLGIVPDSDQKNHDRYVSISIQNFFKKMFLPPPEDVRKPLQ